VEQAVYEDMHRLERTHWWFRARREILSRIVEENVPRGGSILDIGCGTGFVLEHLRDRYDVHGLDDAQIAVDLCHKKGLDFVERGILGKTKLPRESYDMVMFLDVIEHVDDDIEMLKNGERVLAKGGTMLVTVPALQMLWSGHDVVHHHRRRYNKRELETSLRAAGLEPRYISYFNTLLFPLVLAARVAGKLRGNGSNEHSDADAVPPGPINELLYRTFKSEKLVLPRMKLPIGVSLVCVAGRAGETPMHAS
jgi:SAM-dependent methyltransferase